MSVKTLVSHNKISLSLALTSVLALAACDDNGEFSFPTAGQAATNETSEDSIRPARSVRLVDRDVEAPDAFQVTETGLWDGRPSLGGIWVAHPDVTEPERVIIRNQANGTSVTGALFRRERDNPGPSLQVSSDAAAALEMLAGAPVQLQVTALRREEVEEVTETPEILPISDFEPPIDIAATPIEATPLDAPDLADPDLADPGLVVSDISVPDVAVPDVPVPNVPVSETIAAAAAAIEAAAAAAALAETSQEATASDTSNLVQPFIQLGTFTVEENANAAAEEMRATGIVPTVQEQSSEGRTFWRVIVGPSSTESERDQLFNQVKAQGFEDAFFVAN